MKFNLLPSIAYPPAQEGYWGPVTSTINWCEEDYVVTYYSAEIVNTLTNLLFLYLGLSGVRNCRKYGHDNVFLVGFVGYLLVGSGSFAFHSTLKYPWQLVDELSMLYTAIIMFFANNSVFVKSKKFTTGLGTALVLFAAGITLYYHYCQDPIFHEQAFAAITAFNVFRSMYLMERYLRPSWREKYGSKEENQDYDRMSKCEKLAANRRDEQILKELWQMVGSGLSIFLLGFLIWALDTKYCGLWKEWRHAVGLPWGIFLEGHGWWHLMTGYGSYCYIVWAILLRHCLNKKQDQYKLHWTRIWRFPEVVRTTQFQQVTGGPKDDTKAIGKGKQNGNGTGKSQNNSNSYE